MSQVLSQQEIDSLLDALNTGEIDTGTLEEETEKEKVRSYDFRRPIKLSKEYINTLYMIFENFSKIAGNILSTQVHTNVDISLGAVEQISFDEFIRSIPKTTLMGIFHSRPLSGIQILEINPQFCMQAVDLICGGSDGGYIKTINEKQNFTDIELGILEDIVMIVLQSFESAWSEIIEVKTELESMETNPQLVQNMSPNEPVILISFALEVLGHTSFMNICIPFVSFEHTIDKLSFKNWFDYEKETDNTAKEILTDRIISSTANLEVSLGKSIITVDDFLQLELGDILQLDMKITDPLTMYIEDRPHYLVKPGEFNNKLAVQVLQYIEEDVSDE